ncbi:MAG TPA: substrate-binding domain-containing protein [Azospirillaceae bacterium]|nr:substrate-binding domain-containing protein [Azospirillaceae bacterium]
MKRRTLLTLAATAAWLAAGPAVAQQPIKIAHVYDRTGPLEAYAKQTQQGLMLGFEYATKGTMKVLGRPIQVIEKDTQGRPELGKSLLAQAFGDEDADIAIGPTSSGTALAMLPVAEEFQKILIVEPAVADSITGDRWNRYIFRTARNSSQDAVSNAVAVGRPGVFIATLAQDYAFGRDGVAAFKEALANTGAKIIHEEYAPQNTTDFTASFQRIVDAMKNVQGEKYLFVNWAGQSPMGRLQALDPGRHGIKLASGGNILPAMVAYKESPGLEGAAYYYYEIPKNPVNDWLVKTHRERFNSPPDFFTAGGFSAAMAIVTGLEKAQSTDTEKLIAAMRGMEFQTPKGRMVFRAEDHQALQSMYHFRIKVDPAVEWGIPELIRELKIEDMQIPIRNQGKPR